jgi:hypothetical protein
VPVVVASMVTCATRVAATKTSSAVGVAVTTEGTVGMWVDVAGSGVRVRVGGRVAVGVAVTMAGVPVVNAIAVSRAAMTAAVALFSAVGVLVTTCGVGVRVASTWLCGVAVTVPVVVASMVTCATRVAATKTSSAIGVAVTTKRVNVAARMATTKTSSAVGVAVTTKRVNVAVLVSFAVGVLVAIGRGRAVDCGVLVGVSVAVIGGELSDDSVAVPVVTVPVNSKVVVIEPTSSAKMRLGSARSAWFGVCGKIRKSPHNAKNGINPNFFICNLSRSTYKWPDSCSVLAWRSK